MTLGPTATGTETLTGVNTYTGATTTSAGTLALAGTGSIALSSGVADNGTFDISGLTSGGTTITTLSGTGGVTLGANTLTLSNASSTFGGDISGTGGLTLTAGKERLSGANTYIGATNVNGGRLLVSGSIGSLATPSGPVNIASGAILGLRGSITSSGLTNSGTVYARGALNAPVVNNSVFNVTGNLAGTTTFTNNPTASLNVNNGTYAMSGLLTNFASVNVAAGASLSAGSLDNVSTGTIVNLGTVTDDLNNAGTVMNYGVYNANVASNTGSITNCIAMFDAEALKFARLEEWSEEVLRSPRAIRHRLTFLGADCSRGDHFGEHGVGFVHDCAPHRRSVIFERRKHDHKPAAGT